MVCVSCKEDKPEDAFNWKNRLNGVKQAFCRECYKGYKRRHYQKNKETVIAKSVTRNAANRKLFQEWKASLACSLCHEAEEACLDFHHVDPKEKDFNISALATQSMASSTFADELKKCVVLCKNCHTKVHKYNIELSNVGVVFNG